MRTLLLAICCSVCLAFLPGCIGAFAENQARRQAARSADHYIRKYAEPELEEAFRDDPNFQEEYRQGRNDLADTIVSTGNERQQAKGRVGVDDKGWLTKEDRY